MFYKRTSVSREFDNGISVREVSRGNAHRGEGELSYPNGDLYFGQWKTDVYPHKHGKGVLLYTDGSVFEGKFIMNHRRGRGTFTFCNGDSFQGTWRYDMRQEGTGKLTLAQSGLVFRGMWDAEGEWTGRGDVLDSTGALLHADTTWRFSLKAPKKCLKWTGDTLVCTHLNDKVVSSTNDILSKRDTVHRLCGHAHLNDDDRRESLPPSCSECHSEDDRRKHWTEQMAEIEEHYV